MNIQKFTNLKMVYGSDMPVARLVDVVGSKLQTPTQIYYRRPFGVGLLIAGYDKQGPHIYQTCPSANYYRFEKEDLCF
jgi:20S proteasome subunit alpha 6